MSGAGALRRRAARRLRDAGVASPEWDADELLAHVLGTTRGGLLTLDDVPAVQPLAGDVMAGRLRTVSYSARLRAKGGRWLPTEIEVRRLEGVDGPLLLVIARYVNVARRMIHPGQLTARQLSVTAGLFDGLRVAQIAERHGVAVKTIRNQLAAIYDKLDVTGQVELLATYHRPPQPHPRAAAERDGPAADGPSSP